MARKLNDPRRVVGNIVYAKATAVTSLSECARRYGSNSKTKELHGVVKEVVVEKTSKTSKTLIVAEWHLGGGTTKTKTLSLRSVLVEAAKPLPAAQVLEIVALRSKLSDAANKEKDATASIEASTIVVPPSATIGLAPAANNTSNTTRNTATMRYLTKNIKKANGVETDL